MDIFRGWENYVERLEQNWRMLVKPEDVVFISHGTTQATNALLEGDVVKVGIVTIGKGIEGAKSKSDTVMGDIPLTATKSLHSENTYVESETEAFCQNAAEAVIWPR